MGTLVSCKRCNNSIQADAQFCPQCGTSQAAFSVPAGSLPPAPASAEMGFPQAIKICLSKYATFEGRAARPEFWYFELMLFILFVICVVLPVLAIPIFLIELGLWIPNLAVGARRLHDVNKSGWWQLLLLLPILGPIALIVFWCGASHPGANRYGPPPA